MTTALRLPAGSRVALDDTPVDRDPFLWAANPSAAEIADFFRRLSATEKVLPQPS